MDSLTVEMVLLSTKSKDLESVKKLNCWASDLKDVSLLREMPNLEVLTLSLNCIKTLRDVQYCQNLNELYIRNNKIKDLREIFYLKKLNNLKILWLEDNPCTNTDNYKNIVLRNLPNLEKLDNLAVKREDVEKALELGEEYNEPPDDNDSDLVSFQSKHDSFNSTINETQMQELILPISSMSADEEAYGSDIPHTSIETSFKQNLINNNLVNVSTDLETINDSSSKLSQDYDESHIEILNQENGHVLNAILLLIKNLKQNEIDKVIEECQKLKTIRSNYK